MDTMLDTVPHLDEDTLREILRDHQPAHGKCIGGPGCTDDGQTGYEPWPCTTVRLVSMAAALARDEQALAEKQAKIEWLVSVIGAAAEQLDGPLSSSDQYGIEQRLKAARAAATTTQPPAAAADALEGNAGLHAPWPGEDTEEWRARLARADQRAAGSGDDE